MDTYTIYVDRDEDGRNWLAWWADDERAHTFGATLAQVRERATDLLATWDQGEVRPDQIRLVPTGQPPELQAEVLRAQELRERRSELEEELAELTAVAARQLHDRGVSYRDIAQLLGVSAARIGQLTAAG